MADTDVQVQFTAATDDLVSGVSNVKDQIDDLGKTTDDLGSHFENLKELAEAAIAALAVDKLAEFATRMADLGEQIERTSQMTGLSTEQVQQFQYAITQSGGEAAGAALLIERLERNMLQASSGTGAAAEAFKTLGINVTDATGQIRPVQDVLGELADKFSQAENGATKTYYAMTLMGRGGAQLIPVLNQGREGLQELNRQFDQTNAKLAPEMLEALETNAKAFHNLDTAWQGFESHLAADTSIGELVNKFSQFLGIITQAVDKLHELGASLNSTVAAGLSALPFPFGAAATAFTAGGSAGSINPTAPPTIDQSQAQLNRQLAQLGIGGTQLQNPGQAATDKAVAEQAQQEADEEIQIEQDKINTQLALEKIGLEQQRALDQQAVAAGMISKQQEYQDLQAYATLEYQAEYDALEKQKNLYDEGTAAYQQALDKQEILTAQYTAQIEKLQAEAAGAQQKDLQNSLEPFKQLLNQMGGSFDQMIQGIMQGTQTWQQALARLFDNMAVSFIEAVAKMIAEWLLFEAVTSVFGGATASALGLAGGPIAKLVGFDVGSWNVPSTMPAIVHQGEMIIPAQQAAAIRAGTAGIGGGSSVGITMNVSAIDAKSFINLINNPSILSTMAKNLGAYMANNPSVRGAY